MVGLVFGLLAALRIGFHPWERSASPPFELTAQNEPQLRKAVELQPLDLDALVDHLWRAHVVLVGDVSEAAEPIPYFLKLLEKLPAASRRPLVVALELPEKLQPLLDAFHLTGKESDLEALGDDVLRYRTVLRWAHRKRDVVRRVVAMDSNPGRTFLQALFLYSPHSSAMTDAILQARREEPSAIVVALASPAFMLGGGRYGYDRGPRRPVGARLVEAGLRRSEVVSVVLSGADRFPLHALWPHPAAVSMQGPLGELPPSAFLPLQVFGATQSRQVLDFYVHLGKLTPFEAP